MAKTFNDIDQLQSIYEEIYAVNILSREVLLESSLSRIFEFITSERPFVMISSYKLGLPLQENIIRHNNLRNDIRNLNLGYIETYGGYSYGKDQFSHEKSFFIPNMEKSTALQLGRKYDQQSVIYKDDNEFASFYTKNGSKIDDLGQEVKFKEGDVETKFNAKKGMTFDPYVVYKIAYTALVKNNTRQIAGSTEKKDKPPNRFAFHLENVELKYVVEEVIPTWIESLGRKNRIKYLKII